MSKRNMDDVIRDALGLHRNTEVKLSSRPIKSTIGHVKPSSNKVESSIPKQFVDKHNGKWAICHSENVGGDIKWHIKSIHGDISDTHELLEPNDYPMYIDHNLLSARDSKGVHNVQGYEKFL